MSYGINMLNLVLTLARLILDPFLTLVLSQLGLMSALLWTLTLLILHNGYQWDIIFKQWLHLADSAPLLSVS